MFKTLTQPLMKIFGKLVSSSILTEAKIQAAMQDIRVAFIESDVALPVIKDLIAEVKQKALGQEVIKSISYGQVIIKIIHEEMINLLASSKSETKLNLNSKLPVNFLIVGLQGSGKTTASRKLALRLRNRNRKVLFLWILTSLPHKSNSLYLQTQYRIIHYLFCEVRNPSLLSEELLPRGKFLLMMSYLRYGRSYPNDKAIIEEALPIKKIVGPTETL